MSTNKVAQKKQYKKKLKEHEQEVTPIKIYLLIYNLVQTCGWTYIAFLVFDVWIRNLEYLKLHEISAQVWPTIKWPLVIFQNMAILEIIHSLIGVVPAKVTTTAIQVSSRVLLVLISYFFSGSSHWIFSLMVLAWSITECVRYGFYLSSNPLVLGKSTPYFIVWLRYSLFYVLYPAGVLGELGVIYQSLDDIRKIEIFSINLVYIIYLIMLVYIPGLPVMMMHMVKQRSKTLGKKSKVH